jgi:DnaJ-class molecular chaperone
MPSNIPRLTYFDLPLPLDRTDHNPSEEAKQKYLVISRAYEVLADPKKRKIYDMKGEDGLKQLEV